ncbi:MAG: sigma-E factor negative regulatory protein [Gammaproteobacteria bacterium]|nr:sigma-E factor negative regulatory protein [Gammaproteobacteria bacterium]
MTDKRKEAISAIMDGEAHELETRRILDEIGKDDELRAAWDRFHLARSAMAGDPLDTRHGEDAIERLWEAVDAGAGEESAGTVEAVSRRRPFGLRTGAALLGLAASAVFSIWLYPVPRSGGEQLPVDPIAQVPVPASLTEQPAMEAALSAEERARAQAYMLQHLKRQSMANRGHPVPFAKLATYRPQPQFDTNE